jgi:excisionase family DNA binding protein
MTTRTLPPDLLTIPMLARRLGISETTARSMVRTGQVPEAFKVGRQWRISRPRLERRLHGTPSPSVHPEVETSSTIPVEWWK